MIEGISHITFIVSDLEQSGDFLKKIFDAKEVYSSGDATFSKSKEKFFLIGNVWIAIMEGTSLKERSYNHVAFKIDDAEFEQYKDRIQAIGVDVQTPRTRIEGEGRSLYFYDYDNHLFELHTGTLSERLVSYNAIVESN